MVKTVDKLETAGSSSWLQSLWKSGPFVDMQGSWSSFHTLRCDTLLPICQPQQATLVAPWYLHLTRIDAQIRADQHISGVEIE
jgi:hypothetical protein